MPEVKDKTTGQVIAKMPYDTAGKMAAEKMVAENPGYEIKDGAQRSEQMYAGGGKTGYSQIGVRGDMPTGPDLPPADPGTPDLPIPSMEKGGKTAKKRIKEGIKKQKDIQRELADHHWEATQMQKRYSEYDRPKTSAESKKSSPGYLNKPKENPQKDYYDKLSPSMKKTYLKQRKKLKKKKSKKK